jgi:hypothetical protein
MTGCGAQRFPVDVKSKSVRYSFLGMKRVGTHLRVPVSQIRPLTIYVFGVYLEQWDDADVLRWEWGQTLINNNEQCVFKNSNGKPTYVRRYEDCRSLDELMERLVTR